MSAILTLLTTVAIASGFAAAPVEAGPYRQDQVVQALVNDRIHHLFQQTSASIRSERTNYLAGFTLWYDSNCDFLPMPTFEAIRLRVKNANQARGPQGAAAAVEAGYQDAKAFLAEKGCAGGEATAARRALSRFWDGTTQPPAGPRSIERANDAARY